MEIFTLSFFAALLSLVAIDLVLAGDNAVVIAMAARNLPEKVRRRAMLIGTGGAVVIRALMTMAAVWLLSVPYLQAVGGIILLPIALKLLMPSDKTEDVDAADNFWAAVKTIIVADAAMGIDNVLAIAGASGGSFLLVVIGLLISVPVIIGGSTIIGKAMDRWPVLVYIGSGILAWTAGSMVMHDSIIGGMIIGAFGGLAVYAVPSVAVALICLTGWLRRSRSCKS